MDAPNGNNANVKVCPMCAEQVLAAAVICRYCGHDFRTSEVEDASGAMPHEEPARRGFSLGAQLSRYKGVWIGAGIATLGILVVIGISLASRQTSEGSDPTETCVAMGLEWIERLTYGAGTVDEMQRASYDRFGSEGLGAVTYVRTAAQIAGPGPANAGPLRDFCP